MSCFFFLANLLCLPCFLLWLSLLKVLDSQCWVYICEMNEWMNCESQFYHTGFIARLLWWSHPSNPSSNPLGDSPTWEIVSNPEVKRVHLKCFLNRNIHCLSTSPLNPAICFHFDTVVNFFFSEPTSVEIRSVRAISIIASFLPNSRQFTWNDSVYCVGYVHYGSKVIFLDVFRVFRATPG